MRTNIGGIKHEQIVTVAGLVEKVRDTRYMVFVLLRDNSGMVQISLDKEHHKDLIEPSLEAIAGSFVEVTGKVNVTENVKSCGVEIVPQSYNVLSVAEASPIQVDNTSVDSLLQYRWLDLRSEKNILIFEIQTYLSHAMRLFLIERGFIEIHSPKLIGAASESGSEVFEVKYFDRTAYLAQSPQFYKQMAMAAGFDKVFECGPVFRAEQSFTNRHATEFTGFDIEISYIKSHEEVMAVHEQMLAYALEAVHKKYNDRVKEVFGFEIVVPTLPFPRMDLSMIYKELEARYNFKPEDGDYGDLSTEAERLVGKLSQDMFGHEFMFATGFKADKRAFYHMRDANGIAMGYDLIWKNMEITTGAMREHRYDMLKSQAQEKGLGKDVEFYLDFFKYGCPPHGGFGMGLDRITMLLLNLTSIKEAMYIFRGPNRLFP